MKKAILAVFIILLIFILILIYKKYTLMEITFGYENMGATSINDVFHYQFLPQWEYKILKDGSVYYRETEGVIGSKDEYRNTIKEYDKSYRFIKKIDNNSLNRIIEYVLEQNALKQEERTKSFNSKDFYIQLKDDDYYIQLKRGFNEINLRGEMCVNNLIELIQN